jgi:hypothetical protein
MTYIGRKGASGFGACVSILSACLSACGSEPVTELQAAASCFVPAVRDPDFATTTDWTAIGSATFAASGARLTAETLCDHGGMEQTLTMPPLACAQGLVMHMDLSTDLGARLNLAVGVNGGWTSPLIPDGSTTIDTCLGAGASGGVVRLFVGGGNNQGLCPAAVAEEGPSLAIRHLGIEVDTKNACPLPGTVPDGDFEGDARSWSPRPRGGTAEIVSGRGDGASSSAHLATDLLCESPAIVGRVSLPTSGMVPNPALRIWAKGSSNATASVRIGPVLPAFLTGSTYISGTNLAGVTDVCIPRWAQGTVQPLELAIVATEYAEACSVERARDFVFDDLTFVSDPACATDANLFDPGFEQISRGGAATPFWSVDRFDDEPNARAELKVDASAAHTGEVSARLTTSTPCPNVGLSGSVTVPIPSGTAGAALKFWYKTGVGTHAALDVTMSALPAPVPLPATTEWTQVTACLDGHLAGRPDLLRFAIVSAEGGGLCADTFPPETVSIDDVELTTDAGCPAP